MNQQPYKHNKTQIIPHLLICRGTNFLGPSWSWPYDSWIYNYPCNQCLSLLMLWVWPPFRRGVLDTTLCDKVCQWHARGRWVSSINKTDCHDITEILLKVALNTINRTLTPNLNTILKVQTRYRKNWKNRKLVAKKKRPTEKMSFTNSILSGVPISCFTCIC